MLKAGSDLKPGWEIYIVSHMAGLIKQFPKIWDFIRTYYRHIFVISRFVPVADCALAYRSAPPRLPVKTTAREIVWRLSAATGTRTMPQGEMGQWPEKVFIVPKAELTCNKRAFNIE